MKHRESLEYTDEVTSDIRALIQELQMDDIIKHSDVWETSGYWMALEWEGDKDGHKH